MIDTPLVSAIVPTFNNETTIARCLSSICAQSYHPIELIVVDNSSSDATVPISKRYTKSIETYGPERSAQSNRGVQLANGKYVFRIDADFMLDPEVVSQAVSMCENQGADAIAIHNSPDVTVSWIARIRKFEVDMYRTDPLHTSARFVRRDAYLAVGGLNELLTAGEDYDFQNRLNASGYRTAFISAEAVHLGEPTSLLAHLRKYYVYGQQLVDFVDQNRSRPHGQLGPFRGTYVRHWRLMVRRPIMTLLFGCYSSLKFASGGLGFAIERLSRATSGTHRKSGVSPASDRRAE